MLVEYDVLPARLQGSEALVESVIEGLSICAASRIIRDGLSVHDAFNIVFASGGMREIFFEEFFLSIFFVTDFSKLLLLKFTDYFCNQLVNSKSLFFSKLLLCVTFFFKITTVWHALCHRFHIHDNSQHC